MDDMLNQRWDLESIFPGGSESKVFADYLDQLEADVAAFRKQVTESRAPQSVGEIDSWVTMLDTFQAVARRMRDAGAFVGCLNAQDMKDQKAKILGGRMKQIHAGFNSVATVLDAQLLAMSAEIWNAVLADDRVKPIAFNLEERRSRGADKMGVERESLAGDLAIDGYHGWGDLYNVIIGRMHIPFTQDGKTAQMSVGQASNKMASGDRAVREQVFANWESAFAEQAELFASTINGLAGFRINLYKHRGWDNILHEPLETNRMTQQTLDTMWSVVAANRPILKTYLERKAKLLGLPGLSWHDVTAPLTKETRQVSYAEATEFVIEQFAKFSPGMADFTRHAISNRWVEAEDRPGKRPGAFCTSFPNRGESRVFMTFGGTVGNVSTLAHELGHAYHQSVMGDLPQMATGYAMNVAETASTFAEMIVADASLKNAQSQAERISLLADKAENAVQLLMNIHSRFIFETAFYAERKKGLVSVERLNELMVNAQKESYANSLTEYHPHFWASKLHFYSTGQPFYNFPYTFGFLFSSGVYARALAEGPSFADKYVDLLRDTGRMRVEDLAARHLGADLTRPEFWQSAVDLSIADINEFLKVTE